MLLFHHPKWIRAAAAAALVVATGCRGGVTVQTAPAVRRALVVPILADGTLEPPPGGDVRAPEAAVIAEVLVREGQEVTRGTPLVVLENSELSQRVLSSRGESTQFAEEMKRSATEAEAARRERDHLRAIVASDERLLARGAITGQQATADQMAYQQSIERLQDAESHAMDAAQRKRIADSATAGLQRRAAMLTLRAPADGVAYNLPDPGASVAPGQPVATVGDPTHMRVGIRVDAPDLPRVHAGQKIVVTFNGLPNDKLQGTIVLVPPGLREAAGREVGEVIGEIAGNASGLPANASVNVEIIVGEKPAALVIPRGALQREGNTRFVYLLRNGHAKRAAVTVGLIGPTEVEIVSGLREGDHVILPGAAPIQDGDAVRT